MKPWTEWFAEPGYVDFMLEVVGVYYRTGACRLPRSLMAFSFTLFTDWDEAVRTACDLSGGAETPTR